MSAKPWAWHPTGRPRSARGTYHDGRRAAARGCAPGARVVTIRSRTVTIRSQPVTKWGAFGARSRRDLMSFLGRRDVSLHGPRPPGAVSFHGRFALKSNQFN